MWPCGMVCERGFSADIEAMPRLEATGGRSCKHTCKYEGSIQAPGVMISPEMEAKGGGAHYPGPQVAMKTRSSSINLSVSGWCMLTTLIVAGQVGSNHGVGHHDKSLGLESQ
jgi:hypothetical protein